MKNLITVPFSKEKQEMPPLVSLPVDLNTAAADNSTPPPLMPNEDELSRLRDILFGAQARDVDKHLAELENSLQTTRRDLTDLFTQRIEALAASSNSQINELRNDFHHKLEEQGSDQTMLVRSIQKDILERMEKQSTEQTALVRGVQKDLTAALEKLESDSIRQFRTLQKELSEHIERVNTEQTERVRALSAEVRQRDENLHNQLLAISESVENRKASRQEIGQVLVEMGLRFRRDADQGGT